MRAAIALTPEERPDLTVQDVTRHRSPHRFVRIERAEIRPEQPDPEDDPCDCESDDDRSDTSSTHLAQRLRPRTAWDTTATARSDAALGACDAGALR